MIGFGNSILRHLTTPQASGGPVNQSPSVSLTAPAAGATATVGTPITVSWTATDSDGTVALVKVYLGHPDAGGTELNSSASATGSFSYTPLVGQIGARNLYARAWDDQGAIGTSLAIAITVVSAANVAPTATLTAPAAGSYVSGKPITISWTSADSDGSVTSVSIYDGATLLYTGAASGSTTWTPSSLQLGAHDLTAVATDNGGATGTSAAVTITVTDAALPSSYAALLSWQTAEDAMTTVDAVAQAPTSWTASNVTVAGSAADPFAGTAAYSIFETVTSGAHSLTATWTGTRQNGDCEFDIYVKREGSGGRHVAFGWTTAQCLIVNLDTGAIVTASGINTPFAMATVASAGSGWWRVRGIVTGGAATPALVVWCTNVSNSVASYAGTVTEGVRIYSAMGYAQQRMVSSLPVKAGTCSVASAQSTAVNRPQLTDDPLLGKRVIGTWSSANTKTLVDDPAIATALSGSDTAFTFTWIGRSAASTAADWFKLTGATASHVVLATKATHGFGMARTDDAASAITPTFAATDFTLDRNWHVYSIVFSGTTAELWIDGQKSSTTFGLDVGTAAFTALTTTFIANYWRERSIYSRALSTVERSAVELGMISRAGLPVPSLENPLNIPGVQGWWETDYGITRTDPSIATAISAWTQGNVVISTPAAGVYRYTESTDGSATSHYTDTTITNLGVGTTVYVVEAKRVPGGRGWVRVTGNTVASLVDFDLVNGVVGTQTSATGTITPLEVDADGERWYRCTMVYLASGIVTRIYPLSANNTINYQGDGRASIDVRNLTLTQQRISAWQSKGLDRTSQAQGTASIQPLYADANYLAANRINGKPSVCSPTLSSKSLNAAALGTIFSGDDTPISWVGLYDVTLASLGGNAALLQVYGGVAAHYSFQRQASGGMWRYYRKDDASADSGTNGTDIAAVTTGVQTLSDVFGNQQWSSYVNGSQIGVTATVNVGTCTFGSGLSQQLNGLSVAGFAPANRQLTTAERVGLENGFKRRFGLI